MGSLQVPGNWAREVVLVPDKALTPRVMESKSQTPEIWIYSLPLKLSLQYSVWDSVGCRCGSWCLESIVNLIRFSQAHIPPFSSHQPPLPFAWRFFLNTNCRKQSPPHRRKNWRPLKLDGLVLNVWWQDNGMAIRFSINKMRALK